MQLQKGAKKIIFEIEDWSHNSISICYCRNGFLSVLSDSIIFSALTLNYYAAANNTHFLTPPRFSRLILGEYLIKLYEVQHAETKAEEIGKSKEKCVSFQVIIFSSKLHFACFDIVNNENLSVFCNELL